jgi:hypothetical protein
MGICLVFVAMIGAPAYVISPEQAFAKGGWVGLLVVLGFEALFIALLLRRTVLTLDATGATLTLRSIRLPFSQRVCEVRMAEIVSVVKQLSRGRGGSGCRLALVLQSGAEVPLTNSYFGSWGRMDRDAAAIRAFLGLVSPG